MAIYYENILANENYIAKPNVVWVADITSFELTERKKIFVFFCIDAFTNTVLISLFRSKTITTTDITKKFNQVVCQRLPIKPRRELIIHTDRGSQFTSKAYNDFVRNQEGFILASMSRANSPKDNPVAERFMRTFKEHKIDGKTFQEELYFQTENNTNFRGFHKLFNTYVKSLNLKPNKKPYNKPPEQHDNACNTASMLMVEPKYSKAFSEYYGDDSRQHEINQYRII